MNKFRRLKIKEFIKDYREINKGVWDQVDMLEAYGNYMLKSYAKSHAEYLIEDLEEILPESKFQWCFSLKIAVDLYKYIEVLKANLGLL